MLNDDFPCLFDCAGGKLIEIAVHHQHGRQDLHRLSVPNARRPGRAHRRLGLRVRGALSRERARLPLHDPEHPDLGDRPAGSAARAAGSSSSGSRHTMTFGSHVAAKSPHGAAASRRVEARHVERNPSTEQTGRWPDGVRLPIIVSVHHQSEEAAYVFDEGRSIRSTTASGNTAAGAALGGSSKSWASTTCGGPGSSAAPRSRNIRRSPAKRRRPAIHSPVTPTSTR